MNTYYIQVPCFIVSEEDSMVPIVQRRETEAERASIYLKIKLLMLELGQMIL